MITAAAPVLPPGKNTNLRVTLTVAGHRSVTFALAELDPSFGNLPAVLTLRHGVGLVVPGDHDGSRSLADVRAVHIAVSTAGPAVRPVRITSGR